MDSSEIRKSVSGLPDPELSRIFFHSLMTELSQLTEEIGDYTAKDIIYKALQNVPEIAVEWGDPKIYGKNKLLLGYKDKVAVFDTTPVQQAIKLVWNAFISSRKQ